jgi:single-strand selective monofunctional uracil DNA glycosylase
LLGEIAATLRDRLVNLRFSAPVTHVYNPLDYAFEAHKQYLERYGGLGANALLIGMNPGPWGMAQTGVPFGEVAYVRDWLGIDASIGRPNPEHPKRPVEGLACQRSEVSGRRLWGWAKERFHVPSRFFERFFVINYCPLMFMEESGRNRTPDKLAKGETDALLAACDQALNDTVEHLQPTHVIGVGKFAESRARSVIGDRSIVVASILHPSPANPHANRGWAEVIEKQLGAMGLGPSQERPQRSRIR